MNLYVDFFDYLRSPTGLETASLLGNTFRLASAITAGATSLPVAAGILTTQLNVEDRVTIFDGSNSEIVIVGATVAVGATSIPLLSGQTVQFNHAIQTPCCSDGPMGSLADAIDEASQWLENICHQSLFSATYTNETLRIPSMRASLDNQDMLWFRPRHFPVSGDTGITMKTNNSTVINYDATQIIIDSAAQVVGVPWLVLASAQQGQGGSTYSLYTTYNRRATLWLQITYTAGYTAAAMPPDLKDACNLLVSEILSRRQNPTGGDMIRLDDKILKVTGTGDNSGDSILVKRARDILQVYTNEAY